MCLDRVPSDGVQAREGTRNSEELLELKRASLEAVLERCLHQALPPGAERKSADLGDLHPGPAAPRRWAEG